MEIKTTHEIIREDIQVAKYSTDFKKYCSEQMDKKWVSVESLKEWCYKHNYQETIQSAELIEDLSNQIITYPNCLMFKDVKPFGKNYYCLHCEIIF